MLMALKPVSTLNSNSSNVENTHSCELQHKQLGNLNHNYLNTMAKKESVIGICGTHGPAPPCVVCVKSKSRRLQFSGTRPRATIFLQNVHVDFSGINRVTGLSNESYYILFTDDFSTFNFIYGLSLKNKEHVIETFKNYIQVAERQTGRKLIQFTLDNGSEFVNSIMDELCKDSGIVFHLTAPYTPEQNGVSERGNQTVVNIARTLMIQSGVPLNFWYLACSTAVFLKNRSMTSSLDSEVTPYEMWNFRKPQVDHIRIFGCLVHRLIRKDLRVNKFSTVKKEGVLVGFTDDNYNYKIYDLESKKVIVTHDVVSFEDVFPFRKDNPPSKDDVISLNDEDRAPISESNEEPDIQPRHVQTSDSEDDEPDIPDRTDDQNPRRSNRERAQVDYRGMEVEEYHPKLFSFAILPEELSASTTDLPTPRSYRKALESSEKDEWIKECDKEMTSLTEKNVWKLVD